MAQPQKFERAVDFTERTSDETDHVGLNSEFDAAGQSINQIRENLALIQRDDGTLAKGVVNYESLTPDALVAIRGPLGTAIDDVQAYAQTALEAAQIAETGQQNMLNLIQESETLNSQTALAAAQAQQSALSAATDGAAAGAAAAQPYAAAAALSAAEAASSFPSSSSILTNGRMWLQPDGVTHWENPATGTYVFGCWRIGRSGAFAFNIDWVYVFTTASPQMLEFTTTAAQPNLAASDRLVIEQQIDGPDMATLTNKTCTVSGVIRSDVVGEHSLYIRDNRSFAVYCFPVNVLQAGIQQAFSHTIYGGLTSAAEWNYGGYIGAVMAAGSSYRGATPGVWAGAGAPIAVAGQVNIMGAVGRHCAITDIALVPGRGIAQGPSYAEDGARMRRLYRKDVNIEWSGYISAGATCASSTGFEEMRKVPNVTIAAQSGEGVIQTMGVAAITKSMAKASFVASIAGAFNARINLTLDARG
jgi:hypothetical protein